MGTVYAKENTSLLGKHDGPEEGTHSRTFSGKTPVKVQRIHIDGLTRTKDDVVIPQIQEVFSASTFKDMIELTADAKHKLERLGIFKGVGVFIDTSKGENAAVDGLDITFHVKESSRVKGRAHTEVGMGGIEDGTVHVGALMPNVLGRLESIYVEYSHGIKSSSGYNVVFQKPFPKNWHNKISMSGYMSHAAYLPSSYKTTEHGVNTDLEFVGLLGKHNIRWDGIWRELSCMTRTASFDVREQSGHSLKSAIKHIFTRDTRDDILLPTRGLLVKISQEAAGYTGGDVKFLKGDAELQLHKTIFWDWIMSMCLQGGLMKSLSDSPTSIQDRFFIGGPLSVRGFNMRGIGPRSQGDSLGGEAYCAAGLHLYTPLPFTSRSNFLRERLRTHLFVNAGNLCNLQLDENRWKDHMSQLRNNMRLSYGVGLVFKFGQMARFELNYCIPQISLVSDSVSPGIQFGVGMQFL